MQRRKLTTVSGLAALVTGMVLAALPDFATSDTRPNQVLVA